MSSVDKGYINLYLGELKQPWVEHCARHGHKPGAAIRESVAAALEAAEATPSPSSGSARASTPKHVQTLPEAKPQGSKLRRGIRLWPSEVDAISRRAELEGCSWQAWTVNVLRGCLTKQPQIGMKEFEVLGASNYQLAAIGRNLNQIARRINDGYDADLLTVERLDALLNIITAHTKQVSAVMGASIERWDFDQ
jgi:hypothetical protein